MPKSEIVYAFIDSQNLNMGVKSMGWSIDYRKFRQYLRNKYRVVNAYIFIGYIVGNESLYTHLQQCGFILIFKPTMELPGGKVKGNVDAELVLHSMIELPNYSKAIIVSGDGDFRCLIEYLDKQGKLSKIMAPNKHFSGFLRQFNHYITRVDLLRSALEYKPEQTKKTKISGRSKP